MTARVLVVDDIPGNVKLLEAKLSAEYFEVWTADSGARALEMIAAQAPDIVLLDVMMPGMDGFETCRRIKSDPQTAYLPVVMVTALNEISDRVRGLQSGADDFLTKPVNDLALFARVRSLVRLKMTMDEWRLREETCQQFDLLPGDAAQGSDDAERAQVLEVEDEPTSAERVHEILTGQGHNVAIATSGAEALSMAATGAYDLILVSLMVDDEGGLRLCSQLRSREATRQTPILLIADEFDASRLAKALDIGASDYLIRPIDRNELIARARTQIRRRRYQDRLRANYERSLSLALTDGLTGLYNRRYMARHLEALIARARDSRKPLSAMLVDVDRFKSINDAYGHAAGDSVLRAVAGRLGSGIRNFDMVARLGGEEFVILMPDTPCDVAAIVAERVRERIAAEPISTEDAPHPLKVTVSIGVVTYAGPHDTGEALIKRADAAMYAAKAAGRNQVVSEGTDLLIARTAG